MKMQKTAVEIQIHDELNERLEEVQWGCENRDQDIDLLCENAYLLAALNRQIQDMFEMINRKRNLLEQAD
ncbi:MAG TPA: hypothetical protein VF268_01515 [Gammaproteobacteria bacterium]